MNVTPATFIFVLTVVFSDTCSVKKSRYKHNNFPKGQYTLCKQPYRECTEKYKDVKPDMPSVSRDLMGKCALPPGFSAMFKGIKILDFSPGEEFVAVNCDSNVTINGNIYSHPKGFSISPMHQINYAIKTFTRKQLLYLIFAKPGEIEGLPADYVETFYNIVAYYNWPKISMTVLRSENMHYRANLTNWNLDKGFLFRLRALSDDLYADIIGYTRFLQKYGNYVYKDVIFGNYIEVVLEQDFPMDFLTNTTTMKSEITKSVQNGKSYFGSLSNKSIDDSPFIAPLYFSLTPLYEIIDTKKGHTKIENLKKMTDFMQRTKLLTNAFLALKLMRTNHGLALALKKIIADEVEFICPSQATVELIENGLVRYDNFRPILDRFSISCTEEFKDMPEINEVHNVRWVFSLIPGLCFTKELEISRCTDFEINFPPNTTCLKFYSDKYCNGTVLLTIGIGDNLERGIVDGKSFTFC